jgi:GNAT superfamily N-acetyltransferase
MRCTAGSNGKVQILETGPDDEHVAAWCEVRAATQCADRPDELPRPASDHVALARRLDPPGGSMDGTHRAAIAGDTVVGALRLLLPVLDNTAVAYVDLAVHPAARRRGVGSALLTEAGRLAAAAGRTALVADVDEPVPELPGRAFALRHGWRCEREHRGHRLGARIKVAVLREVAATLPAVRRISTYNADSNRPMVAVNEALGFRRAGGLSTWSRRL